MSKKTARVVSIDIEHSENVFRPYRENFYMTCVGMVDNFGNRKVVWIDHSDMPETEGWADAVRDWCVGADRVIAHNLKHDMTILRNYGISFEEVNIWCTMLAEYILSGQDTRQRTFSLDAVAKHYGLGGKLDKVKALWDRGVATYDINSDLLEEYVLDDCQKALDIYLRQQEQADELGMRKVLELQMEFTLSLSDMELYGFRFDKDKAMEIVEEYTAKCAVLRQTIQDIVGEPDLNIASPKQVSAMLFGGTLKVDGEEWVMKTLKSRPETTYYPRQVKVEKQITGLRFAPPTKKRNKDGSVPTDKAIIEKLRCKTPEQKIVKESLLEYSILKKAAETLKGKSEGKGLVSKIAMDGAIHPNFNQAVATTGRLTSSDPNGQNLPRGNTSPIKECIVPLYDWLVQSDLSQIEWRAAAWLSQDPVMIREINEGIDQHSAACVDLMELPLNKENRTFAKIFNFRMIYGGSAYGFYMDSKMPDFTLKKWQRIVDDFYKKYSGLARWQYRNFTEVMKYGYLTIATGRRFKFIKNFNDEYEERKVKNYPVQGIAGGDILPLYTVMVRRGLMKGKFKSRLILTVHDSIVLDVVEAELDRVIELLQRCLDKLQDSVSRYYNINWNTHLEGEIEIGRTYGSLKEV
jgi:DNA polymerase-1